MILICPRCGAEKKEAILDRQICPACNVALYPIGSDNISSIPNELHITDSQMKTLEKERQRRKAIIFSHIGETTNGEQVLGYITALPFKGTSVYSVYFQLIGKRGKLRLVSLYGPMGKEDAIMTFDSRKSRV